MKLIKIFPVCAVFFAMSAFTAEQIPINKADLYGSWNCNHQAEEPTTKMKVKVNYDVNFAASGESNGSGSLFFLMPNFPELEYRVTDSSHWQLQGNELFVTSTQITSKNISYPELDKLFNIKQFIPETVSESAIILELTKTLLKVNSQSGRGIYTCSKVTLKS